MAVVQPVYQLRCGWQALLVPRCPEPRLQHNLTCDFAVVGAGYTGLAAARTWAEARPQDRIAVLDASIVGEGSPGRGSGFLLGVVPEPHADPDCLARCSTLLGEAMDWLRSLVDGHGIPCEFDRSGAYWVAETYRDRKTLERRRDKLAAAGLPFEEYDRAALERQLGTQHFQYGLYSTGCSLVQPAALIRGLADSLPANVTVYEESPAVELRAEGDGWRVECPEGSLFARRVLVANNAFARGLGIGGNRLAAVHACAGLTAPLARGVLAQLGSESRWGLLPAHRFGDALRRTGDGRLLISACSGYGREEHVARVAQRLARRLARRFPQLGVEEWDEPFQHVWCGAVGVTRNGAPLWGEVRPRLFVAAGCNGAGVLKGTLLGRLLADLALGRPVPDIRALFGSASVMAPEPLRRLAFVLRSAWERRRVPADLLSLRRFRDHT